MWLTFVGGSGFLSGSMAPILTSSHDKPMTGHALSSASLSHCLTSNTQTRARCRQVHLKTHAIAHHVAMVYSLLCPRAFRVASWRHSASTPHRDKFSGTTWSLRAGTGRQRAERHACFMRFDAHVGRGKLATHRRRYIDTCRCRQTETAQSLVQGSAPVSSLPVRVRRRAEIDLTRRAGKGRN